MILNDERVQKNELYVKDTWGDLFKKYLSVEKGSLISLGAGYGRIEIPLARMGFQIIGVDNDPDVLNVLSKNAGKYAERRLTPIYGNLYDGFYTQFIGKNIQACISFGVMEHFTIPDLKELIKKQFLIAPLLICFVPTNTKKTLETFNAQKKPEGNVDEYGIYRNFWTSMFWEKEIFSNYNVIDTQDYAVQENRGFIEGITLVVKEHKEAIHESFKY